MALDDEDAAEMTRQRSDLFGGDPIFVAASPRWHPSEFYGSDKKDGWRGESSRRNSAAGIPAKSLLAVASK